MAKQANLTCIMIAQQFKSNSWKDWSEGLIKSKNIKGILNEIVRRANTVAQVSEAYGILHDKDTQELYDPETDTNYNSLKTEHGHFVLKFSKGATLVELAIAIGIEPQYIEKAKSGRYGYDNLLAYLIHAKDSDKFQYDPKEVVTVLGKDYVDIYKEKYASWKKGKLKKDNKDASEELESLIDNILKENISKNDILLDPKLQRIYTLFKSKINDAFLTLGEIKSTKTKTALENGDFKKTILFITGNSGLGKTTLAKELIGKITELASYHGQKWQSILTAGTNIFDEVNGEEILHLDDVRGDSLSASDWLKLLDPYTISPISARYQNRMGASRVVIITSTKHPLEFFYHTKGNDREDLSQYIRRFDSLITLNSESPHLEIKYFQSSPRQVNNRRRKLPHSDIDVYLNYDFDNNSEMKKEELFEFLLTQVCLNHHWDLENLTSNTEQSKGD